MKEKKRIAIIGAGAAACFAAANIPRGADCEVVVFEKTGKALQKVKVSGGGRCNVTHACFEIPELVKRYPRGGKLLKKSLHHFSPKDTIDWFAARGVAIKQEGDGRMFPVTDSSQTIIDCLLAAMEAAGADIRYHHAVKAVSRAGKGFEIVFENGGSYAADKVMLAAGSILKPEAFAWLKDMGHTIEPAAPSLFTFNVPANPVTSLMGLSVDDATVRIEGTKIAQRGPVLITHWGFSGPAVLRASAWGAKVLQDKGYDFTALINWLGDTTDAAARDAFDAARHANGKSLVMNKNPFGLPKRLWEHLSARSGVKDEMRWAEMPAVVAKALLQSLTTDRYAVRGKTTYKEEFVTCGGVSTAEVNPQTMESRLAAGLHFGGECLNVDGITGGYNFQHAWCSGFLAGKSMIAPDGE